MPKMPAVNIKIKHDRNVHEVAVDTSQPATAFKQTIFNTTGVPPERQKVMVKGGLLKDDTDLAKLNLKPGQTLMVIGSATELPKAPSGPVTFLEDMTDSQLAEATKDKVGLVNLGNTCYLNSTLQVLRAIPELQVALNQFQGSLGSARAEANLTASLRDLYRNLGSTTDAFPPLAFLSILRQVAPQFAEQSRQGGFAQQDAEEAWVRIVSALQSSLGGLQSPITTSESSGAAAAADANARNFVEQYLTGGILVKRSTKEAPEEEPSYSHEPFSILQCNISMATNDMSQGINDSLNQQLEKTSESLGRTAVYDEERRISRLPAYLTTHFVRFYWRREIGKKTKIMRKVRFPFELDVTEFLSDELKQKTRPYREKLIELSKERDDRARVRRKARAKREEAAKSDAASSTDSRQATATTSGTEAPRPADGMAIDTTEERQNAPTDIEVASGTALGSVVSEEEERKLREKEDAELAALIHPDLKDDVGANVSGLYELVGIVTHKGADADGGHYISWVLKEDDKTDSAGGKAVNYTDVPSEEWYKFDDEKVSTVAKEKITSLDGGGQDSTAYILLYRSKKL